MLHHRRAGAFLTALLFLVSGGCRSASESSNPSDLASRVDAIFARHIRADTPGCALGVYQNGSVALATGYGLASLEDRRPITPQTTFSLGSVSKQFTAFAVLLLEQAGRLTLDADVRRAVPEMRDYGTPITIRDLLQHTSGLRDFGRLGTLAGRGPATLAAFAGLMADQRALNFTPGTRHEYSHSDYALLAMVVERVTGEPFGPHLEREVFQNLGMTGTRVHDGRPAAAMDRAFGHLESGEGFVMHFPSEFLVGGDNVYTSVTDLARWDRNFEDAALGGRAVVDRMLSRPTLPSGEPIPYAFGLRHSTYRGLPTITRGGNDHGSRTEIIRFPTQRFTVTTLCNGSHLPPGTLGEQVADVYLAAVLQPAPAAAATPEPVPITSAELQRYAGTYRPVDQPWNLIQLDIRDGRLAEQLGDTHQPFTHLGGGRFEGDGAPGFYFTFRETSPGAMRLQSSSGGELLETSDRIDPSALWQPSESVLGEYAGVYYSEDIDAGWRLVREAGRLAIQRHGQVDRALRPIAPDVFLASFGGRLDPFGARVEFHRDTSRLVTHVTVSTAPGEDSVQGLRFDRVAPADHRVAGGMPMRATIARNLGSSWNARNGGSTLRSKRYGWRSPTARSSCSNTRSGSPSPAWTSAR